MERNLDRDLAPERIIAPDRIIADVLTAWPQTIRVFLDHQMACVGCTMAGFDTVADAAASYGKSLDAFLAALRQAASSEPAA